MDCRLFEILRICARSWGLSPWLRCDVIAFPRRIMTRWIHLRSNGPRRIHKHLSGIFWDHFVFLLIQGSHFIPLLWRMLETQRLWHSLVLNSRSMVKRRLRDNRWVKILFVVCKHQISGVLLPGMWMNFR